jgi:hypothetical protein
MHSKLGCTAVSTLFAALVLTACGGGGGGGASAPASKAWGTAALIETDDSGSAFDPQIAFDANGNALAVWVQDGDPTAAVRYDIWSNRYTAGSGWGTPVLIESDNSGGATDPQIAFDANGNALAVWDHIIGGIRSIVANRYTAGSGWGAAVFIETDNTGDAFEPQIAIDANGNALAVWYQDGDATAGFRTDIWSNRYTAGVGWGTAVLIETDNTGSALYPRIALDAGGNALAVWEQDGDPTAAVRYDIWSNRYTAGPGWGTPVLIETNNSDNASAPQIALDANGNALAVWYQFDGAADGIWSNRYTAGSGWGSATLIENNAGDAADPQIAFDASGNALAVWDHIIGGIHSIVANRHTAGSGWGTAGLIENNAGGAAYPQIAIDANGNALAVWYQDGDATAAIRNDIWANRYQ